MRLTEEQKQAIIADAVKRMQAITDDPLDDRDDLYPYEDEMGRCYNHGSCSLATTIEEICEDNGIPGIEPEFSDICISLECEGEAYFHDSYDPGDYWTPPSGGIELDEFEFCATDLYVEIDVYNEATEEYESIEVSEDELKEMVDAINAEAAVTREPRKTETKE